MDDHDGTLKRVWGVEFGEVVATLVAVFEEANKSDVEAGARWYDEAGEIAGQLAYESGYTKEVCASVIAHLSVRKKWAENVLAAHAVLVDGADDLPGQMAREMNKATKVRDGEDDWLDSLGPKTSRFAMNILGDRESVTVDVWACRGAGLDERLIGRPGAYAAVEAAYQAAAVACSVDPATMQATVWVVTRGGRHGQPSLW